MFGLLDVSDGRGSLADQLGDRPGTAALSGRALASGDARVPSLCSNQWNELNFAQVFVIELVLAGPGDSNQALQS